MISVKNIFFVLSLLKLTGWKSAGGSGSSNAAACTTATQNASDSLDLDFSDNIIPVYVADDTTTGSVGYLNEPLVSVKICSPGHTSESECQIVQ